MYPGVFKDLQPVIKSPGYTQKNKSYLRATGMPLFHIEKAEEKVLSDICLCIYIYNNDIVLFAKNNYLKIHIHKNDIYSAVAGA